MPPSGAALAQVKELLFPDTKHHLKHELSYFH